MKLQECCLHELQVGSFVWYEELTKTNVKYDIAFNDEKLSLVFSGGLLDDDLSDAALPIQDSLK